MMNSDVDWYKGKRAAVSLTFDDARPSQIDHGLPVFRDAGVSVTFFVSPPRVPERGDAWLRVCDMGHEIGAHTMRHPCSGNFSFAKDTALEDYDLEGMEAELEESDRYITENLGVTPVSFAYPCGQTYVGSGQNHRSYVPLIAARYLTGRGYRDEIANDPERCDLSRLNATGIDGVDARYALSLVEEALDTGGWLVFAGHEIGVPEDRLNTRLDTLKTLLGFLYDHGSSIWTAPMGTVAKQLHEVRNRRI